MIFSIVQQATALMLGLMLLVLVWYRPGWILFAAISVACLLDCFGVASATGEASAGAGLNIYGDDVAGIVLLIGGVLLFLRYPKSVSRDHLPCFLLLLLVALSVGRGLGTFGLKQAGNSVRSLFEFVAPAITIMLLRPTVRLNADRLARWLVWAGSLLSAIAVLRWAGVLTMPKDYIILDQRALREVIRALPADYAIVIGQAFIAVIYLLIADRRKTWWWWIAAAIFGVVTLALQHRSVWTATAVGVMWLAVRTTRRSPLRWLGLGATTVVALAFVLLANPSLLQSADELLRNGITETETSHSTWAWRVDGYTEATERVLDSAAIDQLIGPPAGWSANSGGSFASIHIHSRYVDTLAYYGFIGTTVLLVWFAILIRRCWRRSGARFQDPALSQGSQGMLQALLISELVYLIPYFGGLLQGSVLGLIWLAAAQTRVRAIGRRSGALRAGAVQPTGQAAMAFQS